MIGPEVYVGQRPIPLRHRIGKGGEGEVYSIDNDTAHAVKLYTVSDWKSREPKILAMIRADLATKTPLVAFPTAPVRRKDGSFVGFLMRLVADHSPLHDLYSPGSRKHNFPQADYRFLVRAAANVARAVASVHQFGCVIGDINHSSILVSSKATVSLIDADSFQVTAGVERFPCRVGVPEYTPPELQGQSLANVVRTPNHDAFGLAIVVFQLLFMGRHPFIGTVRKGDLPPLPEAIRDYRFVYAENRDVGMDQPPGTPVLSDFSADVATSFESAFSKESRDRRPSAAAWIRVLDALEESLVQCNNNRLHFGPRQAPECPWCDMESELGTYLFVPYLPQAELAIHPFDPGAGGFNIDRVWNQINSRVGPSREKLEPKLRSTTPEPSPAAHSVLRKAQNGKLLRVGAVALALAILIGAPYLWILWIPLGWFGLFGGGSKTSDTGPFTRKYIEIEGKWNTELYAWQTRCGISEFSQLQKTLEEARDAYRGLAAKEKAQIDSYVRDRRAKQLHVFLDSFQICNARIKGIGPAKEAALASYGIESAADIDLSKLLSVPGFGSTNSQGLLAWRRKLEQRFTYSDSPNDADRQQLAQIRLGIAAEASTLRRTLLAGPQNLARLVGRTNLACDLEDPLLNKIHLEREQIRCDLQFLKITPPHVPLFDPTAIVQTPPGHIAPSSSPPPSSSGSVTCPRCGSRMVRRIARRGMNSGRPFWGCSRYPRCRGTRG